jgi:hypothetical protein
VYHIEERVHPVNCAGSPKQLIAGGQHYIAFMETLRKEYAVRIVFSVTQV